MPIELATLAVERSTFAVAAAFTDELGDATTPKTIAWSLLDQAGAIVNDRAQVAIAEMASSIVIVLSGADLALDAGAFTARRQVLIEWTYDSLAMGTDLPVKDTIAFTIMALTGVD
jgi:hypothetical protein